MRLPRVWFTVRTRMVVVAVAAAGLTAIDDTGAPHPVRATSPDPRIATRQETRLHGVPWGMSYDQARERASHEGKPLLIYFANVNDVGCALMERNVLPSALVVPLLAGFVTVRLDTFHSPIRSLD
jgi:thiol:disulfide interchange protein DsbD